MKKAHNKLIETLLLLAFFLGTPFDIYGALEEEMHDEEPHHVSLFTELITSRMYCIARINKVVSFLHTLHKNGVLKDFENLVNGVFFNDWEDFHNFRLLENPEFQIQFIKAVFEILYYIIEHDKTCNFDSYIKKGRHQNAPENLDDMFVGIDRMHIYVRKRLRPITKRNMFLEKENQEYTIDVDGVTRHFYRIRRLQRAKKVINKIKKVNIYDIQKNCRTRDSLQELCDLVTHESVKQVLQAMIETKNIAPLFNLWEELEQFKYADDSRFFKEMLMSIFVTYQKILVTHSTDAFQGIDIVQELDDILDLYENISLLSPQELLNGIDKATDHLSDILHEIEVNEGSSSWKQLMGHWLIPVGALVGTLAYVVTR